MCVCASIVPIASATADDSSQIPRFTISAYQNEYGWRDLSSVPASPSETAPLEGETLSLTSDTAQKTLSGSESKKSYKKDDEDFVDKIMDKIPYRKQLKATWDFVDGETDVMGVQGLRVDRGNKGLVYKTSYMPMMGEVKGVEWKGEVGEDAKLTFKSHRIPFMGEVEGLTFKTSVGDDAKVSLRYAIELD